MPSPGLKTRTEGTVVPPRSKKDIAAIAMPIRKFFGLENQDYFPVCRVYEVLGYIFDGADFEVVDESDMGEDHGRTYPEDRWIQIRNDVYERASNGEARDRFTMCHELGHLVMHRGVALSRIDPDAPPKIFCNSEWQADIFASYLLMPSELLRGYQTIPGVMDAFGVSFEAAHARRDELNPAGRAKSPTPGRVKIPHLLTV